MGSEANKRAKAVTKGLGGTPASRVDSIVSSGAKSAGHGKGTAKGNTGVVAKAGKPAVGKRSTK